MSIKILIINTEGVVENKITFTDIKALIPLKTIDINLKDKILLLSVGSIQTKVTK